MRTAEWTRAGLLHDVREFVMKDVAAAVARQGQIRTHVDVASGGDRIRLKCRGNAPRIGALMQPHMAKIVT